MRAVALPNELPDFRPKPFLKWAGGKGKLVPQILDRFPEHFGRYHEPFLGGGAVFFALAPRKAVLSDVNGDLIATYCAIRDRVEQVMAKLRQHQPTEEHFYNVRALESGRLSPIEAAARTIFLNRTCFNGLYRVNRRGQFNVPFGRYTNPKICNADNLRAVSEALQNVDIRSESVFDIGRRVRRGDLVYFDPPYDPVSRTASFTSYARGGFGREEQERLATLFGQLAERGVHVVLSNSDTPFIRELYRDFHIEQVFARRAINSRGDRRGPVTEVLVSAGPVIRR
ncbi:DNA adenine methylase [Myxococcota bacterium]